MNVRHKVRERRELDLERNENVADKVLRAMGSRDKINSESGQT